MRHMIRTLTVTALVLFLGAQAANTQPAAKNCPYDSDVVVVLMRNNVFPPTEKQTWHSSTAHRTWQVRPKDPKLTSMVSLRFGPPLSDDKLPHIPDALKNEKMVLFLECIEGQSPGPTTPSLWEYSDVIKKVPDVDEYEQVFTVGENLAITVRNNQNTSRHLSRHEDRKVRVGLLYPRQRLSTKLFIDGLMPRAVLASATR